MNILALSGSLRTASINSALLRAAARLAPPAVTVNVCDGLGELPLFNPDLEASPPGAVATFRSHVANADALLIASPEYAHGVTGTIKNALDWLVSFEPFAYKPVALLNASPRAHHADAALREILRTMSAAIVEPASVAIPLLGAKLDEAGMVSDPAISAAIQASLSTLHEAVILHRASTNASFSAASLPSFPQVPMANRNASCLSGAKVSRSTTGKASDGTDAQAIIRADLRKNRAGR